MTTGQPTVQTGIKMMKYPPTKMATKKNSKGAVRIIDSPPRNTEGAAIRKRDATVAAPARRYQRTHPVFFDQPSKTSGRSIR